MDRGEVQVAATMRRWGIQVQKQTAEKQTPHQSGQCGADTFHEARQMIRKEAPSVVGAKEEQGYGASGGGYVSPCVGERMLASLSATLSFIEDQVLGQASTWTTETWSLVSFSCSWLTSCMPRWLLQGLPPKAFSMRDSS